MPVKNSPSDNIFEMVLHSAMGFPGIKISREKFLRKELSRYYDGVTVEKAIETNPAQAGLSIRNLDQIAKACINYETSKATAIAAAAGIPGGFAFFAAIPADVAQYFGHVIRILQKLVYLYGWQDMFHNDRNELDDETANQLTLFIGVMFGVNAANAAIAKIAKAAAIKAEKKLVQKALTQGTIYPVVKQVARLIGVKMTKNIFAKSVGKVIPLLGAVISGGITFISFKPMATRLQDYLVTLPIANVDFYKEFRSNENVIDIDFSDIIVKDTDNCDELLCPSCGHNNKSVANYCINCGVRFETPAISICACGAKLGPEVNFCDQCGARKEQSE